MTHTTAHDGNPQIWQNKSAISVLGAFVGQIRGLDGSFGAILRCEKQPQPNVCQVGVGFGPMLWPLESLCWANWGSKWFVLGHIGM